MICMQALFAHTGRRVGRGIRRILPWVAGFLCAAGATTATWGQGTQPLVAIHDSELTRALETMPASGATPAGTGATGFQWWPTDWHYFVMPESVKEALRSDGTAFTVVGDTNISAGALVSNGVPRYPIVISLACEAIRDDEVAQLTNYVAAGGFLLVGSSSFTRTTNGTARGDFAFANALGVHAVSSGLANWGANNTLTTQASHRLVGDLPGGALTWRLPASADEISWGTSPTHAFLAPHDVWQVQATDATVLAQGDTYPYLLVKPFGKGYFIYHAAFQPLVGHGGFAPGMYAYVIFRRAIEWAFASANLPVPKLSPWPYQYDAAFMVRHDLENFTNEIAAIQASAQVEYNNGAKGDYYFCTGTVRDDTSGTAKNNIIAGLRSAVTNYGATVGPHNGGLKNPNNPSLVRGQYDYWHWGPDEALDVTPAGYASGKAYAFTSISNSFRDVEGWLSGITNGLRAWVGCYFNATREDSYDIQAGLNVKIAGDQKLSPFPHWTLSTQTPGLRYGFLTEPVSDWFVGGLVAQSLEPWHPPGVHTSQTMHDAVDFYYGLGALVNVYSHSLTTGLGDAGQLVPDYVTYCANTNLHPRLWPANAVSVYQWWLQRSNAQTTVSFARNGNQSLLTVAIARAASTNTAIEILVPGTNSFCGLTVLTNGVPASGSVYRISGQVIKLRVGTTVTNAVIGYYPVGATTQVFSERFDGATAPALPAGWTTSASGVQSAWATQSGSIDTGPNAAYSPDPANVGVNEVVSPPIALPAGTAQLTFRNNYDLETGPGADGFDGGVLEIKLGTNAFTDILAAGGSFASGGYTSTIDSAYANPLAGRAAWSGNSGGYISTVVNLPAAAGGQTIQFKWRCGTDNSNGKTGWHIDTITLANVGCLCCGGTASNTPPVLPVQANRTIAPLTTLAVANAAGDSDQPPQVLSYQLIAPPAGAGIDANGLITWTPTSAQGPSTNLITTVVTDNGMPPLSATNSFTVVVTAGNSAPVLPAQANLTIGELTALAITNTATDADLPPQGLSYQLIAPPAGAGINSNGVISWIPAEAQGPGSYTLTTVVTDNGIPTLSATNSFTVTVTEVNTAPALPVQPGRTMAELTALVVTNRATDADIPANTLTYALAAAPAGASITPGGVITWTPSEAQGPSTNTFTTVVSDDGVPSLSATNSFIVTVTEVNSAPALPAQTNRIILKLTTLLVTNAATDTDIPANTLTYALAKAPAGATIDTNGVIAWTPTAAQGPSTNVITTVVTDSGVPPLSATNSFTVFVTDTNTAPVLPVQPGRTIAELTALAVTNRATDADIPANTLAYVLLGAPAGATISTNGVITWTPSEAQGPGAYTLTTVVTDNGVPPLSATNSFAVTVQEVNQAPVLPAQTNRTIVKLTTLLVTNAATDGDIPANALTYALVNPPAGAVIDTNGVIAWTPTAAQGPSTNLITTLVTDNGVPPRSATNTFTVFVTATNSAPALPVQLSRTIAELTTLMVTNKATDTDIPANTLAYVLVGAPAGAVISSGGVITWTPTEAQGPGTYTLTTVASDNGVPPLSATNSFSVNVAEVNVVPVLPPQSSRTIVKLTSLLVTNTATDADLPVNALTYSLVNPPAGAVISTNGIIAWTPTAVQGPSTNVITTVVTDSGVPSLSATNSFTVFVTDTNSVPGPLFADDFKRATDPGPLTPWVAQSGVWTVTGGVLAGGQNTVQTYANAYLANPWTNYSVQAQIQFPTGAYGGGLGGFLNPTTGAHYAAWIYPEASPGGARLLRLVKFQTWTTWGYNGSSFTPMQQVSLTNVGTNWHTLTLGLSGSQLTVSYDTNQVISVTDTEATPYTSGGITVDMWTGATKYVMSVDNVVVTSLATGASVASVAQASLSFRPAAVPAPVIESISIAGGSAVVSWSAVDGNRYRLQFTEGLEMPEWIDLLPDVLATGPRATATNAIGSSPKGFYRVLLVP